MSGRNVVFAAMCLVVASPPRAARADEADLCAAAAEESQPLRRAGKLRVTREKLLLCARASCPVIVATDCRTWLAEVEGELASIVIRATDGAGGELVDVQLSVDGAPLVERVGKAPIFLEPGKHRLRFARAGAEPVEQDIALRPGERGRELAVTLRARVTAPTAIASPAPPPPRETTNGAPVGPWIVGSLGLAAMGVGTYFWVAGRTDFADLRASCGATRTCRQSDVDRVQGKLLAGDVVFGAGVLALGAALVWGLSSSSRPAAGLDVHPLPGGGFVTYAASLR